MTYNKDNLKGTQLAKAEQNIPTVKLEETIAKSIQQGLTPADSVEDKTISCFARGDQPIFGGISTYLKSPYLEDVNEIKGKDVAILGVPYDGAAHFRPGARYGPMGIRR